MVTEEEQSDMELISETIPVPQVPVEQEISHNDNEIDNQLDDIPRTKKPRTRKKTLHADIRKQMEFYFSDANLSRDRFLGNLVRQNPYVDIEEFVRFNKIQALTTDPNRIAEALKDSTMLEVSEDGKKVRRITPICEKENVDECTIYVQRLPRDADHDMLNAIFSQYGSIAYVSIPKYRQSQNIKGFAFVEFDKAEDAEKCLKAFRAKGYELPSETSPSHVLSITTYEENDNKEENTTNDNASKKKTEKQEVESNKIIKTSESEEQFSKKAKKRTAAESLSSNSDESLPKKNKSKKKKGDSADPIITKSENKSQIAEKEEIKVAEFDEDAAKQTDVSKSGKRKKRLPESTDKAEDDEQTESCKKSKKKRKLTNGGSETDAAESIEDSSLEKKAEESKSQEQDEIALTVKEKKKKNRHKHYFKFEKVDATDMGLQVMAKKDWKKLRNKYLEHQKSKMHQLKQHLFKTRRNQWNNSERMKMEKEESEEIKNIPKPCGLRDFAFTPGLIMKIEMEQSCVDVQTFKKEFKSNNSIKYVDVSEGATTAYVRFDTAEAAKKMAQKSHPERKMSIITDDEEKWYWDKMMADRHEKLSKKVKVNQRGRNKLLKKAEKELGKHIKFDEV